MVLCVEADGQLAVEPAIGGRCRDLVQALPAGEGMKELAGTSSYCELCLDLPLASSAAYRQLPPARPRELLPALPMTAVHPLLQPRVLATQRAEVLAPPLPAPSFVLLALRSTVLLI
jgi:hypothetical protein